MLYAHYLLSLWNFCSPIVFYKCGYLFLDRCTWESITKRINDVEIWNLSTQPQVEKKQIQFRDLSELILPSMKTSICYIQLFHTISIWNITNSIIFTILTEYRQTPYVVTVCIIEMKINILRKMWSFAVSPFKLAPSKGNNKFNRSVIRHKIMHKIKLSVSLLLFRKTL